MSTRRSCPATAGGGCRESPLTVNRGISITYN
jgi:hypothetical protein